MNTEININDPTRNEIGEHHRYDEMIEYYVNNQRIINKNFNYFFMIINNIILMLKYL